MCRWKRRPVFRDPTVRIFWIDLATLVHHELPAVQRLERAIVALVVLPEGRDLLAEIEEWVLSTIHSTFSVHGGVVNDPV